MQQPATPNVALVIAIVVLTFVAGSALNSSRLSAATAREAGYELNAARIERDILAARIVDERDEMRASLDSGRASYARVLLAQDTFVPKERPKINEPERTTTYYKEDRRTITSFTYDENGRRQVWLPLTREDLARAAVEAFQDRDAAPSIVVSTRMDDATQRDITTTYYLTPGLKLLLAVRTTPDRGELQDRWYFVGRDLVAFKDGRIRPQRDQDNPNERQRAPTFAYPPFTQPGVSDLLAELDLALERLEFQRVSTSSTT
jgi:hypothetical protein